MFGKILIANRGEIACRISRTCRRLGVRTVAVYSDADVDALHVEACDEAYRLGPAPARDSYLCADRIVAIACHCGAEAIHPGYGFLSENASFAEACAAAGIVFIGPPPAAIRAMGSKSAAKALLAEAGVPLVPGFHGEAQDLPALAAAAAAIGYPLLIKASGGGGGKGMRVVESAAQFAPHLESAQREARAAFGDDRVLLEKYVLQPRHVELQIFADRYGHVVHLYERDCSMQRRHQKVMEEAPAPGMTAERRQAMGAAAIAAARAVNYVGAGTVEFLLDRAGAFYFMEMNTRLQVEHPVTEMITGLDLVEWQLRVAAGEPLPLAQEQITATGHAFEARIYAEDPARDFLPATGRIADLRMPASSTVVRIDSGVRGGDDISVYYDPMIAKLIVWGEDRAKALNRLRQALADCQATGVATNLDFLAALAAHPEFAAAQLDTGFIARHQAHLFPAPSALPEQVLALAALSELLRIAHAATARARASADPWSPWHEVSGWRLNDDNHHTLHFLDGDEHHTIIAHYRRDHYRLGLAGGTLTARGVLSDDGELIADLDGARVRAYLAWQSHQLALLVDGKRYRLRIIDPHAARADDLVNDGNLAAPMPGTIIRVLASIGQSVQPGDALLILEAMKMEHTIVAPRAGTVTAIHYTVGDQVKEGAELLSIAQDLPG